MWGSTSRNQLMRGERIAVWRMQWDWAKHYRMVSYLGGLIRGHWRCPCGSVTRNWASKSDTRPSHSCSGSSSSRSAWLSVCRCSLLCWWETRTLAASLWLLSGTSRRRSLLAVGIAGHVLITQHQHGRIQIGWATATYETQIWGHHRNEKCWDHIQKWVLLIDLIQTEWKGGRGRWSSTLKLECKTSTCVRTLAASSSSCPANTVYVFLGIVWGVVLHDPVYLGNVETSCGYVSTQKNALEGWNTEVAWCGEEKSKKDHIWSFVCKQLYKKKLVKIPIHCQLSSRQTTNTNARQRTYFISFAKLEKCGSSFLLFLFAVYIHDFDVNVVQQFGVELDRTARGEEHL